MEFKEAITTAFYKSKGFFIKHAPTILAAAGVSALVGAGVYAAIKAPKVKQAIDNNKAILEEAKGCIGQEVEEKPEGEVYTADDYLKLQKSVKIANAIEIAKGYAAPAGIALAGAISVFYGNHINNKRVAAGVAAAASAMAMLDRVRKGVVERYGEKAWADLRLGINPDKKDENGNPVETPTKITDEQKETFSGKGPYSDYSRIFDETNPHYKGYQSANLFFLNAQQQHANDLLNCRGYLYLNEVYEMLGFEQTAAGQMVGWYRNGKGDNYVSFGHTNKEYESSVRFLNGEPAVILDFNVDGPILDHFPKI